MNKRTRRRLIAKAGRTTVSPANRKMLSFGGAVM